MQSGLYLDEEQGKKFQGRDHDKMLPMALAQEEKDGEFARQLESDEKRNHFEKIAQMGLDEEQAKEIQIRDDEMLAKSLDREEKDWEYAKQLASDDKNEVKPLTGVTISLIITTICRMIFLYVT